MKYYRIKNDNHLNALTCGETIAEAIAFAQHLYTGLNGINLKETSLKNEIENYLRYEADEIDCIYLWNEYCDQANYSDEEILHYGDADMFVRNTFSDWETMYEELDRLYYNGARYTADYIILDHGHGDVIGDFNEVWDDYNYEQLAEWLADGNSYSEPVRTIMDEFTICDADYELWQEEKEKKESEVQQE